ncbi:hypothetical protein [Kribbella endophytica]
MSTVHPSVVVRPLATPLPLGFLALCIATQSFSAVQLACVIGFLARDPSRSHGATGVAHLVASDRWLTIAGWIGVVLTVVSLYAALAFELEGITKRAVLPLFRSDDSRRAGDQEPGVRPQL